jgi:hypothetical protein
MQKEELSDSRNRQAAPRNEGQHEDQIWQRVERIPRATPPNLQLGAAPAQEGAGAYKLWPVAQPAAGAALLAAACCLPGACCCYRCVRRWPA